MNDIQSWNELAQMVIIQQEKIELLKKELRMQVEFTRDAIKIGDEEKYWKIVYREAFYKLVKSIGIEPFAAKIIEQVESEVL